MGGDKEYDSIEPGKRADLSVIEGDPVVFRDGLGYDGEKLIASVSAAGLLSLNSPNPGRNRTPGRS